MNFQWLKKIAAAATFLLATSAQAGMITDVEAVNKTVSFASSKTWTHNILDQGFVLGSALSASLMIEFRDDKDPWYQPFETALIQIGRFDLQDGGISVEPTVSWTGDLGFSSLIKLNADGTLKVKVTSVLGDFIIGNSILTVITKDAEVKVPEPSTIMLFCLGLLGLVAARKKAAK
jgi:hypothetical protein